jgi:hypothetical protein
VEAMAFSRGAKKNMSFCFFMNGNSIRSSSSLVAGELDESAPGSFFFKALKGVK